MNEHIEIEFELLKIWIDRWITFYGSPHLIKFTVFHYPEYNKTAHYGVSSFDELCNRVLNEIKHD